MAARCKRIRQLRADLYVPIHTNAAGASARYLLFMFYQDNDTYRKIFNAVAPKLEAIYPGNVAAHFGARPELVEVKTPKAKTIYCELGFHTNQTDVDEFIHDPDKVGKALAEVSAHILEYPQPQKNRQRIKDHFPRSPTK